MPLSRNRERELILRLKENPGDDVAFSELYEGLNPKVLGAARARTRTQEDAEDVAQDSWIKFRAYIPKPKMNPDVPCMVYLRLIVEHTAANLYGQDRLVRAPIELADLNLPDRPKSSIEEQPMCRAERLLDSACKSYSGPPNERLVFLFNRPLGMTPTQIAESLFAKQSLGKLAERAEQEYGDESSMRASRIHTAFAPLREDMDRMASEFHLGACTQLVGRKAGDVKLVECFGDNPINDVVRWSENVKRRIVRRFVATNPDRGGLAGGRRV